MQKISPTALLHAARQDNHRQREDYPHCLSICTISASKYKSWSGEEEAKTHQSMLHAREARSSTKEKKRVRAIAESTAAPHTLQTSWKQKAVAASLNPTGRQPFRPLQPPTLVAPETG
jgi:hypothetical protein